MTVDLAKHEPTVGNTQHSDTVRPVVLRFTDDPHLALRGATRKTKRIANHHTHLVLEKNPDTLPAFSQSRALELRRALCFDPLQVPLRGYDLHFAIRRIPPTLGVFR